MSDPVQVYNTIAESYLNAFNEPSDHIESFTAALKPKSRVLDLGCGPGVDTAYMSAKKLQVHGVDAAANMIALAKLNAPKASFETGDIRTIDYGSGKYDGIVASYSLIHVPKKDVLTVFDRLSKALKPSGYLFLGVQTGDSQEIELYGPLNPDIKIFLNIFSKPEIYDLLTRFEFEILEEYERFPESAEEFNFIKYCVLAKK